jgi:putative ABC transport system permease protein
LKPRFHRVRSAASNHLVVHAATTAVVVVSRNIGKQQRFGRPVPRCKGVDVIGSIIRDVRTSSRALLKAPGFALVTIITLAVAIGANTAIFSVVEGVLLRPLPYPESERLVTVAARTLPRDGIAGGELPFSDRGYWHFVNNNRAFEKFGGYTGSPFRWALTGQGPPIQVEVSGMTVSAFEALGVPPQVGRWPTAEEDVAGGPRVALLSNELWAGVFGSDPDAVGRTIEINGVAWEVIGVMPAGYDFPAPGNDVWIPRQLDPGSPNFGGHHLEGIGRLAPGVNLEAATSDAERLIASFGDAGYGPTWFTGVFTGEAAVRTLHEGLVGDVRRPLLILLGTVGFVLLIACSNIANLFMVRAETRTRETAVRVALGSGRGRLVQFILTESVLLGLLGGAAGVLLAILGTRMLVAMAPPGVPRLGESVLALTLLISVLAGLAFGLIPAMRAGSPGMLLALRDGGRSGPLQRGHHRLRNALVVLEVALALVLLVGAGLMVRSFQQLRSVDPGFEPGGVLTFNLSPAPVRYENDPVRVARFYDQLLEKLESLPGVTAAGAVNTLPLTGGGARLTTVIDDFPPADDEFPPVFLIRRATPGYFEAMGIPVIEGRAFNMADHEQRLGSLIISKSIKDQYWPNSSALGKRITTAGAPARVVGVVGDIHDTGLDVPAEQFVYKPMLDSVGGGALAMTVAVRTAADPMGLLGAVRDAVQALDADLPVTDVRTMSTVVGESLGSTTFTMTLLATAAGMALFLGAVGIFGVISYIVSRRTVELGVRQALGADAGMVRRLVLSQGMRLAAAGVALGVLASLALGRVIAALLFDVSPYDSVTLAGGALIFLAVAALASALPAERAARIPPAVALRAD